VTPKLQKILATTFIGITVVTGLQALIYILNLDQSYIFWQASVYIYLYLLLQVVLLFDLHAKRPGYFSRARENHKNISFRLKREVRIFFTALWDRFEHLRRWGYLRQWIHFLLLPSFIFWASVSLFYVNFNYLRVQETVAILSSVALIANYWNLKEVFYRRKEIVDRDIFVVLTVIKIYAAGALFAASMSFLRYYCLSPIYFSLEVFGYTFLLIYQALYQHRKVFGYTLSITLIISILMALIGYLVYVYWGFNYFTAAVFMSVCYNLFWGIFHYRLDRELTWQTFAEIFLVSVLIAVMVISITNFRARILDGCSYAKSENRINQKIG